MLHLDLPTYRGAVLPQASSAWGLKRPPGAAAIPQFRRQKAFRRSAPCRVFAPHSSPYSPPHLPVAWQDQAKAHASIVEEQRQVGRQTSALWDRFVQLPSFRELFRRAFVSILYSSGTAPNGSLPSAEGIILPLFCPRTTGTPLFNVPHASPRPAFSPRQGRFWSSSNWSCRGR